MIELVIVVTSLLSFAAGFYLGVVKGAPAWRAWALEEQKKQNANYGSRIITERLGKPPRKVAP